jgi:hypothetical protein
MVTVRDSEVSAAESRLAIRCLQHDEARGVYIGAQGLRSPLISASGRRLARQAPVAREGNEGANPDRKALHRKGNVGGAAIPFSLPPRLADDSGDRDALYRSLALDVES